MKIAHITTSLTGGAGIAALRVHQGLLSHGVESSLVQKFSIPDGSSNIYRCTHFHNLYFRIVNKIGLNAYLTQEGRYEHIISKYPQDYEIVTYPISYFRLEDHPIIKNADIIHLHWVADFLNYPTFFDKIEQPIVWTLHDQNPFLGLFHFNRDMEINKETLGKLDNKIARLKTQYIHQKENITIVSPSEWLKSKSEKSEALGKYPHYVIPHGFDLNEYLILDKYESKRKLSINNDKPTILFVAHSLSIYRKGLDILLEALEGLNPSGFNLISVGDEGKELAIDPKINYISFGMIYDKSKLNIIYNASDITVIPSREDNSPNVMFESLLNGTPVISFTNGGMPEHIKNGENGILIDEINSEALRHGINDFLNKKYIFDSNTIREYITLNISSKLQSERYINLYNEVLNIK